MRLKELPTRNEARLRAAAFNTGMAINKLAGIVDAIVTFQERNPGALFMDCNYVVPQTIVDFLTGASYDYVLTTTGVNPNITITRIAWDTISASLLKVGESKTTYITGSNATTTGQVLVDITGLTTGLQGSSKYEIEGVLLCSVSAVTTGVGYGINFTTGAPVIACIVQGSTTTTADKTAAITANNTAVAGFLTTSGMTGGILIKGSITTTLPGILSLRHLKTTSGTSTVLVNSSLKVTKVS